MTEKQEQSKELVFLNKASILGQDDLVQEQVNVPEWNGFVYVRTMTAEERDAHEIATVATNESGDSEESVKRNMENFRARLCAATIVNANGKRLFATKDIPLLSKKNGRAIGRIYDAACKVNGIGVKDVEDLSKN